MYVSFAIGALLAPLVILPFMAGNSPIGHSVSTLSIGTEATKKLEQTSSSHGKSDQFGSDTQHRNKRGASIPPNGTLFQNFSREFTGSSAADASIVKESTNAINLHGTNDFDNDTNETQSSTTPDVTVTIGRSRNATTLAEDAAPTVTGLFDAKNDSVDVVTSANNVSILSASAAIPSAAIPLLSSSLPTTVSTMKPTKPYAADGAKLNSDSKFADGKAIRGKILEHLKENPDDDEEDDSNTPPMTDIKSNISNILLSTSPLQIAPNTTVSNPYPPAPITNLTKTPALPQNQTAPQFNTSNIVDKQIPNGPVTPSNEQHTLLVEPSSKIIRSSRPATPKTIVSPAPSTVSPPTSKYLLASSTVSPPTSPYSLPSLVLPSYSTHQMSNDFAYWLIAAIVGLMSVIYAFQWGLCDRSTLKPSLNISNINDHLDILAVSRKIAISGVALAFKFFYSGIEVSISSLLTTFVMSLPGCSWTLGVLATMAFWFSFACGRMLVSLLLNCIQPYVLALAGLFVSVSALIASTFATHLVTVNSTHDETVFWFLVCTLGLGLSAVHPAGSVWMEKNLAQFYDLVNLIGLPLGEMLLPTMTGILIVVCGPNWFLYVLLTLTILCLLTFLVLRWIPSSKDEHYSILRNVRSVGPDSEADDVEEIAVDTNEEAELLRKDVQAGSGSPMKSSASSQPTVNLGSIQSMIKNISTTKKD